MTLNDNDKKDKDNNKLENKKAKLLQKIQNSKDKFLKHQIDDMNNFLTEQKELETDYQEILTELIAEESNKQTNKIASSEE